jgi:hypothetical protein
MSGNVTPVYDVNLSITPSADSGEVDDAELEATAEEVIEAVRAQAAFVALGAVVSLNLIAPGIDLFCEVMAENPDELHNKVARVFDVMLQAANGFQYSASATQRAEFVSA